MFFYFKKILILTYVNLYAIIIIVNRCLKEDNMKKFNSSSDLNGMAIFSKYNEEHDFTINTFNINAKNP